LKILHTADVHLGARFSVLGPEKGNAQRLQLQRTFERIGELAVAERVDLFVVAGDLFDSNTPSASSVDVVRRVFGRLVEADIRVFAIPGTHDCFDSSSVWRTIEMPAGVTVFTDRSEPAMVPELDLAVHGLVFASKKAPAGALLSLARCEGAALHVGIAHGSVAIPGILEDDSVLFTAEEVAGTGMDYLALGHWHSFKQERFGDVTACYPGSPEFVSIDQKGAGQVALVEIDRDGTLRVEPRTVGVRRFESLEISVDALGSSSQVVDAIRARADADLVLDVTLAGLCPFDFECDIDEIAAQTQDGFFHLRLRDKTHPRLDDVAMAELAETSVAGRFARVMRAHIEDAAADDKGVFEDGLRLGVALLEGRQVL